MQYFEMSMTHDSPSFYFQILCLLLNCLNSFITVGSFSGAADLSPLSPDFLLEA